MSIITSISRSVRRYLNDITQHVDSLSTLRRDLFRSLQEQHKSTSSNCRYAIKDRSDHTYTFFPNIRRNIMENKYITRRVNMQKKKCFENIENIQKQWYKVKRMKYQRPQTTYDSLSPNLWVKVKDMYNFSNFYDHPESFYRNV